MAHGLYCQMSYTAPWFNKNTLKNLCGLYNA